MRASAPPARPLSDMKVVILLGAPGAGKGTQAPLLAERLGIPIVATGDLFRAAVRDGTPLGIEARRYMDAGQLVPDEITVRLLLDRLGRPDADRGVILDGFPRTDVQASALDEALASRDSGVARRRARRRPAEELIRRMSGRWVCRAAGHPYHETVQPAARAGRLRPRRLGAVPARPTTGRRRSAPGWPSSSARWATVVDHYRASGVLRDVDGLQAIDAVGREIAAAVEAAGVAPSSPRRDRPAPDARHPQVPGRDRARCAPPGGSSPRSSRSSRRASRPGVSTAELDRLAERHIRGAKGVPSFLNYLGGRRYDARDPHAYPASTCISIDDEIVHGIPGDREIRAGQLVSVDVGVIYEDWHGDGARTFVCGGPEPATAEARGLVDTTRLALMAGVDAPRPGNFIADISGAVEDVAAPAGYGIVRQYVGHGIGTSMHEDPQVPNFRSGRRACELEPGLCLAIEPMLTLGDGGDRDARRRLDGRHLGRVARRAFRAHHRRSRPTGPEILTTV